MVDSAKEFNAGQMQMVFRKADDTPIAAVIVVRGEWTQQVLAAIEQLEQAGESDCND
jgi:hypothetical protein